MVQEVSGWPLFTFVARHRPWGPQGQGQGKLSSSVTLSSAPRMEQHALLHPFATLPEELCLRIFSFLSATDLLALSLLCRDMHRLASDNSLWEALCACNFLPSPPNGAGHRSWFGRIARSSVLVDRKHRDGSQCDLDHFFFFFFPPLTFTVHT